MAYPRYTFFSRCERPASARQTPGARYADLNECAWLICIPGRRGWGCTPPGGSARSAARWAPWTIPSPGPRPRKKTRVFRGLKEPKRAEKSHKSDKSKLFRQITRLANARLGSARLASARRASERLASARLSSGLLASARLMSACLASARLASACSISNGITAFIYRTGRSVRA
jgi:hypothetical protein